MSEPESTTVRLAYAGKRMTTKRKLADFWWRNDELHGYQRQLAPAVIGEIWQFTQIGTSIQLGSSARTGDHVNPERVKQWEAESAAAIGESQRMRADAKLSKRKSQFEKAIEPLRNLRVLLRTHEEIAAFDFAVQVALRRSARS